MPICMNENVFSDPLTGFQWEDLNIGPRVIKAFLLGRGCSQSVVRGWS